MAENEFKIDTFRAHADEDVRSAITSWLVGYFEADSGIIKALNQPETGGMSASSFLIDIELEKAGKKSLEKLVIRRTPERDSFYKADVSEWGRAMQIAGQVTDLPIPKVYRIEPDPGVLGTPFILMDRHEGNVPGDQPPFRMGSWVTDDCSTADREQMWKSAISSTAKLHQLDWKKAGLDFLIRGDENASQIRADLDYYIEFLDWALRGPRTSFMQEAIDWLEANLPEQERLSFCWGDARPGNMMFEENKVTAILDWEMVSIGDPTKDIGWWIFADSIFDKMLDVDLPEGCISGDALARCYEEITDTKLQDLNFYIAFGGFRTVALYARAHFLQKEAGLDIPETMSLENAPNVRALQSFLENI